MPPPRLAPHFLQLHFQPVHPAASVSNITMADGEICDEFEDGLFWFVAKGYNRLEERGVQPCTFEDKCSVGDFQQSLCTVFGVASIDVYRMRPGSKASAADDIPMLGRVSVEWTHKTLQHLLNKRSQDEFVLYVDGTVGTANPLLRASHSSCEELSGKHPNTIVSGCT
jgi:hypothetical protein